MAGYQHTIIVGNVGGEPVLEKTGGGASVCRFSVAVTRRWTDRATGDQREDTTWFRVSTWRNLAETCHKYVHKGMAVLVEGRVSASAYMTADGDVRASLDMNATSVQFIGKHNGQEQ